MLAGEYSNERGCRGEGGCDGPEPVEVTERGLEMVTKEEAVTKEEMVVVAK